ncbi:MAG TPA: methylated-DNA--[protein]-cysteine S-methyltransferase [Solirubrobacteraceae bacterium]|jgi:O-6-methylguanine DNA methyltransferase
MQSDPHPPYSTARAALERSQSFAIHKSPLGPLLALADAQGGLTGLYFTDATGAPRDLEDRPQPPRRERKPFAALFEQLDAYFAGELDCFDLDLATVGSPFQERIWTALREIPYGQTATYGELAREIGHDGSARAAGMACGRNPIAIVVPCHRVVGASGSLTGYAGGIERKRALLAHERAR